LRTTKFIPFPACDKGFFTVLAHPHIIVLIREHEGKVHLHHDEQGVEVPYDNGRILFKSDPVSWCYAAESGNALTVQAAGIFINRIVIKIIEEICHKGKHQIGKFFYNPVIPFRIFLLKSGLFKG